MSSETDIHKLTNVETAGGIAVSDQSILLNQHKHGGLAIPKGHIEAGETYEQAAVRELKEETGYDVEIVKPLGQLKRKSVENSGETVIKTITVYLMRPLAQTAEAEEKIVWVKPKDAIAQMHFAEEADFIQSQLNELKV